MSSTPADQVIRFSVFEFDARSGVLRKRGSRLPVQGLPLQVLAVLLEKPGEVVTREEIRSRLWPADTFVDFDHSLHNAIARLREALGDSATAPRFIETLPRRGYRFMGTLDNTTAEEKAPATEESVNAAQSAQAESRSLDALTPTPWRRWIGIALAIGFAAILGLVIGRRTERPSLPVLHQVTFRRGTVWNARFSPDGNSFIYGAAWDGNPVEIFEGRLDSTEGRPLGFPQADVLAVSPAGELALLLNRRRGPSGFGFNGTLARVPITGGTPRPVMEKVEAADWGPDGSLAVIDHAAGNARLEYPIGTVRYESATWLSDVRVSPKGDMVAFVDHDEPIGDSGTLRLFDSNGTRQLTRLYGSLQGLAWSPSGNEIWFTAAESGGSARSLRAVDLAGHERVLYRVPGALKIQDVTKDGRVLLVHELMRAGILAHVPGEEGERELGWLDWSIDRSLSQDGKWLLFDESGDAPHGDSWIYLRRTDGSATEKLGSGSYSDLSPDGKWVAAVPADFSGQLTLLPTGSGQPRTFPLPLSKAYGVAWFPDGKQVALAGSAAGKGTRIYVVNLQAGTSRPISPEGSVTRLRGAVSPDGQWVAGLGGDGNACLYPVASGTPRKIPGLLEGESVFGWTADGKSVYVGTMGETVSNVYLIDLAAGHRRLFRTLAPTDKAGLTYLALPSFTPDGRYYVYSYNRQISELFVADGIK